MKLYFKELDFKELGVLGYSDLLGMGVLGYSDLLGLGVPDEWLLDLPYHHGLLAELHWLTSLLVLQNHVCTKCCEAMRIEIAALTTHVGQLMLTA